jgi:hypothetical protein
LEIGETLNQGLPLAHVTGLDPSTKASLPGRWSRQTVHLCPIHLIARFHIRKSRNSGLDLGCEITGINTGMGWGYACTHANRRHDGPPLLFLC